MRLLVIVRLLLIVRLQAIVGSLVMVSVLVIVRHLEDHGGGGAAHLDLEREHERALLLDG